MHKLIFTGLLLTTATCVQADNSGLLDTSNLDSQWFWQLQSHNQWQQFDSQRANNPDNQILKFDNHINLIELQPEFELTGEQFKLNLQPRLSYTYQDVNEQDQQSDAQLRYWSIEYFYADHWIKAGQYVNLWGPARLVSPSNRYHLDSGQTNPNLEIQAREYIQFGGALSSQWQYLLTINYDEGQQTIEDFNTTGELQLSWQGEQLSLSGIVAKLDNGVGIGGYGQWTVDDALIVYADLLYSHNSQYQSWQITPTTTQDSTLTLVSGFSYTFESGFNITLDGLYHQNGLTGSQSADVLALNNQLTGQIITGQGNAQKFNYVSKVNNLPFYQLGKHYLFLMMQQNNIEEDTDLTYLMIQNLGDDSRQHTLTVDHRLLDWVTVYAGLNLFEGDQTAEFSRFLDNQYSAGFKLYF